jgi:hypothetical protein
VDEDVKFVPEISTTVPPVVGPTAVEIPETATAAVYVNTLAAPVADCDPLVVTLTFCVPAAPAGDVAVIFPVTLLYDTLVAAVEPKTTVEEDEKLVPEISTTVPPPVEPVFGLIEVTCVADVYVKLSAATLSDVPPRFVTRTSTVPVPAGKFAVIWVELFTVKDVALFDPKVTAETFVKPVPVITTPIPPASAPTEVLRPVTVGAAT